MPAKVLGVRLLGEEGLVGEDKVLLADHPVRKLLQKLVVSLPDGGLVQAGVVDQEVHIVTVKVGVLFPEHVAHVGGATNGEVGSI